jgi:hypothetical protein
MATIGLMGAMPEEMDKVISEISGKEIFERGSRLYYKVKFFHNDFVLKNC